ncbi:unnamed protein product [Phytophthora fragariaefolia]|uniref:Unnamed protein product n=1 Tax=Phytophthora fragariaefolia TaxID=1490495 RepID=A0A9W7D385_9STRA|nr:unnamed protein product [Phytophthora fragariaefolia]
MVEVPQLRVAVQCEADRPAVFVLERLVPGKRYTITFGGIREEDVEAKRGRLRTQSLENGNKLNVVAVSGDNVYDIESGEMSLWKDVRERVEQQETQLVLHLGGQVAMKHMFDKAVQLLLLYGEGLSSEFTTHPDWSMMEAKALDVLRSAYRSQWVLSPHLQFVLANASNLMMWSDADVYTRFTTRDEFYIDHEQPTLQIEMLAVAEKALASTAQIFVLSEQIPRTEEELELQKKRHEIEGARRVEKNLRALEAEKTKLEKQMISYNQLLAPQRGEEYIFEVGNICFLVLDLRSSRLEPGGSQARENELLSNVQWRFIEEILERPNTQVLVVCSEAPLIDDLAPESKSSVVATEVEVETPWSANKPAQARLLSLIFEWKLQQASRHFIVLAGANPVRCFARMRMKDLKLRAEAEQITIGAISAAPHESAISKRHGVLHTRFEFEHLEVVVSKKSFLSLKLESGQNNIVATCRVIKDKQADNLPNVVLGPVVGWVDESCAVVLLEVDRDTDIVCLVENPLTRESRRIFQRFIADQANSFFITHLRSGHYYRISFENIQYPERFQGSFTTVAKNPAQLDVVALGNEYGVLGIAGGLAEDRKNKRLWHAIKKHTAEVPFVGLNFTIHLGGQFFPESNTHIHEALSYAGSNMDPPSLNGINNITESKVTTAIIHQKFSDMYRSAWNAPGTRESLAHGAHLFLSNENDQLSSKNQASDDQNLSVGELLSSFHIRYQNLLLPPSKRLRVDDKRWRKPLCHCFGSFGLFVLPIENSRGLCVHDSTWDALRVLLATPTLSTLLLVSTETLIEESLEDIRGKACVDLAYHRKFGFYKNDVACLLEILFDWQRMDTTVDGTSQVKRQVILLSGNRSRSFDTVIREIHHNDKTSITTSFPNFHCSDKQTIFQYVVGPLQGPKFGAHEGNIFTQGTLLGRYTYYHTFLRNNEVAAGVFSPPDENDDQGDMKIMDGLVATKVTNQFVHLMLAINDNSSTNDASELDPADVLTSYKVCTFVSHNPTVLETHHGVEKPDKQTFGNEQVRHCTVGSWQLAPVLPVWLREIKVRMDYLRAYESELQDSFQRSPALMNGLVTLSNPLQGAGVLTESFAMAHRLGPGEFRDKFPEAPSRFIVAFTLQQLSATEPPIQQLSNVGAVEFDQYALIFQHSFVNAWLFTERLEHFWS